MIRRTTSITLHFEQAEPDGAAVERMLGSWLEPDGRERCLRLYRDRPDLSFASRGLLCVRDGKDDVPERLESLAGDVLITRTSAAATPDLPGTDGGAPDLVFRQVCEDTCFRKERVLVCLRSSVWRHGDRRLATRSLVCTAEPGAEEEILDLARLLSKRLATRIAARPVAIDALSRLADRPIAALPGTAGPEQPADAAHSMRRVLCASVAHLVRETERFRRDPTDEGNLHALRVALRGLRSLVSFCAPLLRDDVARNMKQSLREVSRWTAPARDLAVLTNHLARAQQPDASFEALHAWLEEEAKEARETLAGRLGQGELATRLIALLQTLHHAPDWSAWSRTVPTESFAATRTKRWMRAIRKADDKAVSRVTKQAHRQRIRIKKLRYVLARGRALGLAVDPKLMKRLSGAQDALGVLQDRRAHRLLLEDVLRRKAGAGPCELHYQAGLYLGRLRATDGRVERRARKRLDKLYNTLKKRHKAYERLERRGHVG